MIYCSQSGEQPNRRKKETMETATTYKPIWNIKIIDQNGKEVGWAAEGETAKEALESIIEAIEKQEG